MVSYGVASAGACDARGMGAVGQANDDVRDLFRAFNIFLFSLLL